jgi:DNA-binding NarL/FixJ family response regulator
MSNSAKGTAVRVVITQGYRLIRQGLRSILEQDHEIKVVGEADNGPHTIELVKGNKPDVALLDIQMPKMNGIDIITPIRQESPDTKPLILSNALDEAAILKAVNIGACGYLSKNASASDLLKAVHTVHRGEMWMGRKLVAKFLNGRTMNHLSREVKQEKSNDNEKLTPRELEVLCLLATGYTNKEIAGELFISEKTVKSHLNSIFKKLNLTRRIQAVLYAIRRGMVCMIF